VTATGSGSGFGDSLGPKPALVGCPTVRVVRFAIGAFVVAGSLMAGAGAAAAQTTTTMPPVRSIPVTGGQTATTTTTAPAATGGETAAGGDLADTGIAADMLVPFGFALIGGGAVMQAAARRRPRDAYGLL
jgi:hypothetical protein